MLKVDFCDFCFNNSLVTSIIHWSEFIMKKILTTLGWIMGARVHYTLIIKKYEEKNSDFCLRCCNNLKSAPQQFNYFQTFFSFIENEFCFDDVLLFILLLNFWRYIKLIIQNFIWKNKIENDFFFYFRQFYIFISFDIMIMHMNLKFNFNG